MKLLVERAPEFDFFQVVRLLRRDAARAAAEAPEAPAAPAAPAAAGREAGDRDWNRRWEETVRFRSHVSFDFMASDVQAIEMSPDAAHLPTVVINFLGIASPASLGSLPTWYAQLLLDEGRKSDDDEDQNGRAEAPPPAGPSPATAGAAAAAAKWKRGNHAPRAFFDLFNNRLAALFYRSWVKNSLPMQYDGERRERFQRVLFSLLGLGPSGLVPNLGVDVRALFNTAAMLMRRPTTAAALAFVLSRYFGFDFFIDPFVPMRVPLDQDQQLALGGATAALGVTTILGASTTIAQGKFCIRTAPLHWRQFAALLPSSSKDQHPAMLRELISLVRQAVGGEFEFDLQLVLRENAVPERMLLHQSSASRARLGLSSWLGRRWSRGDATDTCCRASLLEGTKQ